MKNKILTICIPTYNRAKFLSKQLDFCIKEVKTDINILDKVQFIVSDNNSSDETPMIVENKNRELEFIEYRRNSDNLGIAGNLKTIINQLETEYVWFLSDDDEVLTGSFIKILRVIVENSPQFIFLNYSSGLSKDTCYTGNSGLCENSKAIALDIFNNSYGSLVLISACIHRSENLKRLQSNPISTWLGSPLLYSFYSCIDDPIYIYEEPLIKFNPGNASYANFRTNSHLKFYEYIKILEFLPSLGFEKQDIAYTIRNFLECQTVAHLLYVFIAPGTTLPLYRYYGVKSIMLFPVNILKGIITQIKRRF